MSSLARAVALRGALVRGAVKQHHSALLLRSQGGGGSSHARLMSAGGAAWSAARAANTVAFRRSGGNGLLSAAARGGGRLVGRAEQHSRHQSRSLGLFSGGPSNEVLRMLEQEAAHSPKDANAEVCFSSVCVCVCCVFRCSGQRNNGLEDSAKLPCYSCVAFFCASHGTGGLYLVLCSLDFDGVSASAGHSRRRRN